MLNQPFIMKQSRLTFSTVYYYVFGVFLCLNKAFYFYVHRKTASAHSCYLFLFADFKQFFQADSFCRFCQLRNRIRTCLNRNDLTEFIPDGSL